MEDKTIEWGFTDEPQNIRGKEHREYLIEQYNRNRPAEEQVHTMEELNKALKREKKD